MADKREPLTQLDIMRLSIQAAKSLEEINKIDPHFRAKLFGFKLTIDNTEKLLSSMVMQYKQMDGLIKGLRFLKSGLRDEEQKYFEFVDIQGLEERQRVRLKSIRALLTIPLPELEEVTLIDYQPQEWSELYENVETL